MLIQIAPSDLRYKIRRKNTIHKILLGVFDVLEDCRELHVDDRLNKAVVISDGIHTLQLLGALMNSFIRRGLSWDAITVRRTKKGSKIQLFTTTIETLYDLNDNNLNLDVDMTE